MPSDAEDLVAFLHERNKPEVRQAALDIIGGLTGAPDGVEQLAPVRGPLLAALLRLAPCREPGLSRRALVGLVNLSQDPRWGEALLAANVVGRVMEFVRERSCPHTELLLMLLVNVTVCDQGCEDVLQLGKAGMEGLHMALLLKAFVTSAVTLLPGQPDPYRHVAALLTNTTRLQEGRRLLMQPGRGFLQALAAQLAPGVGAERRRGCAGALRNVCISAEADGTLDELVADEAVLARLTVPLGGGSVSATTTSAAAAGTGAAAAPAEPDGSSSSPRAAPAASAALASQMRGLSVNGSSTNGSAANGTASGGGGGAWRDPDDCVREALAEAVAALAATDAGRRALWKVAAPEQLRKAYEDEQHPEVCRAMEAAARCFMFDADGRALQQEGEEGQGEQGENGKEQQQQPAAEGGQEPVGPATLSPTAA